MGPRLSNAQRNIIPILFWHEVSVTKTYFRSNDECLARNKADASKRLVAFFKNYWDKKNEIENAMINKVSKPANIINIY